MEPSIQHSATENEPAGAEATPLSRRLGLFDATMIVMGGIIGAGIFMNPYVVAQQVRTPFLILFAWALGGVIALAGALIYAELAARLPKVGGQYTYLKETYHPLLAFLYGWALLLVIQTGGMAAVAVTFGRYFVEFTGAPLEDWYVGVLALTVLTIINCFGVRAGGTLQNTLMILKLVAIVALIGAGMLLVKQPHMTLSPVLDKPLSFDVITSVGTAMIPVLFAYGGWQTANFIAGEVREPRKNLPAGLVIGVLGVVLLYLAVNFVCVQVLGAEGLGNASAPASEVMRTVLGETGAEIIAIGIAISTLGFLSQSILTAPRVYFAMASDNLFFKSVAWVHPRTRVPVVAIILQGVLAIVISMSGRYDQILNYVVSVDFIFFGLTATCLFSLRRKNLEPDSSKTWRQSLQDANRGGYILKMPGHPWTTLFFVAASWLVVINTIYKYPHNTIIGLIILLAGVPVYRVWSWKRRKAA